MADIKSGQDVTSLMAGIKSGDDVTSLMAGDFGSSTTVPEPPRGRDFKIFGVNIHVPPEDKPRLDSNIATVGGVGIAPEDALMVGQAAKGIAAATSAGGMVAGLKEAVKTANPVVKFEVSRRALKAVGVPDGVAEVIAFGVSGYRRGGKPPVPEGPLSEPGYPRSGSTPAPPPAPVEPPAHLDLSQRVPAGGLTQQQIAERLAATKAQGMTAPKVEPVMAPRPSPSSVPVPAGPPEPSIEAAKPAAPSKSPQQILNEEAIAKRRAAYQESLKADAKPVLEDLEAGKMTAEQAAAELAKRWGTPSDAERRFPPNKSGLPSNPPTARKAMGKVSDLADMPATEPPKSQTTDLEAVSERIRNESGGKIAVMDLRRKNSGDVELETIAVSPRGGGEGAATKAMESLVRWADEKGVRLVLSPSEKGYQPVEGGPKTTSTARLKDFYKRFGFVEPKGRNYDPTISSPTRPVMFRKPVETEPSNPPTARKARGKVSDLADMPSTSTTEKTSGGRSKLTPEVVKSAATDAGNRSMRAGGRKAWNAEDYNAAAAEYSRLDPVTP